jgi:hypothetical protein
MVQVEMRAIHHSPLAGKSDFSWLARNIIFLKKCIDAAKRHVYKRDSLQRRTPVAAGALVFENRIASVVNCGPSNSKLI